VGWLVGLIVAGGVYWALSRTLDVSHERVAIADSEKTLRELAATPSL